VGNAALVRRVIVTGCLLAAGCHRISSAADRLPPPEAYVHFSDRVAAQMFHWGIPWSFPCTKTVKENGYTIGTSLPDDQCVKFNLPKRFQGLWRNDFEGSMFCVAPAKQCPYSPENSEERHFTWLEMQFHLPGSEDTPPGGLYAIDFVGRQSEYPGVYGHMGMSDQEVIVDRLISIKEVEPPPAGEAPADKAEAIVADYFKDCKGAQICMPNSWAMNWKKQHPS
jgi:hypothetical protein